MFWRKFKTNDWDIIILKVVNKVFVILVTLYSILSGLIVLIKYTPFLVKEGCHICLPLLLMYCTNIINRWCCCLFFLHRFPSFSRNQYLDQVSSAVSIPNRDQIHFADTLRTYWTNYLFFITFFPICSMLSWHCVRNTIFILNVL